MRTPEDRDLKLAELQHALAEYTATPGEFFDIATEQAKAKVRERALILLEHRARSRSELRRRLLAADFAEEVVTAVLDDLSRVGLIDDAAFAREWVRQRTVRRGKSRRALDYELRDKGVPAPERAAALAHIAEADEAATARQVAAKKARSVREIPTDRAQEAKELRRIVAALARRGFPEHLALNLAREALTARIKELGE